LTKWGIGVKFWALVAVGQEDAPEKISQHAFLRMRGAMPAWRREFFDNLIGSQIVEA
jgi:hypothetical protein